MDGGIFMGGYFLWVGIVVGGGIFVEGGILCVWIFLWVFMCFFLCAFVRVGIYLCVFVYVGIDLCVSVCFFVVCYCVCEGSCVLFFCVFFRVLC